MKKIMVMVIAVALLVSACSSESIHNNEPNLLETEGENETLISSNSSDSGRDNEPSEENETLMRDGDYIVFGRYEQDGNESNGPEPIECVIVSEEGDRTLIMSRYVLDCQQFNTEFEAVTWENCSLRSWLNDDFFNAAFNETEQNQIITVILSNPDNVVQGTEGGNDTEDRVFCLSVEEILANYEFDSDQNISRSLIAEASQYASNQRLFVDNNGCAPWWLRTPAGSGTGDELCACYVTADGKAGWGASTFYVSYAHNGVRPAIYISSSLIPQ